MGKIEFKDSQVKNAWNRLVQNNYEERWRGVVSSAQEAEIKDLRLVVMALVKQVANGPIF